MENFFTLNLALEFYNECKDLKFETGEMKDQFHRASLSVCLNLSEGWAKYSRNDKRRFYIIALGSMRECETILKLSNIKVVKTSYLAACLCNLIKNPGGKK